MPRIDRGNAKGGLTTLLWCYRNNAKERGYPFELTREQFAALTKQNCWYCGREPAQVRRSSPKHGVAIKSFYLYNGVDRVDNSVGYTAANCVPCCGRCNRMKSVYDGDDFVSQIRKIAKNLGMF